MIDGEDADFGGDPLSPVFEKAAIGIVSAMAGAAFGPAGAIAAALVGPFAVHAIDRLNEIHDRVYSTGLDPSEVAARLQEDGALAHLLAEATRAAVESDLAAKRALLARAVVNAFNDDAEVDMNQTLVRAAALVNTFDVRVLVQVKSNPLARPDDPNRGAYGSTLDDIASMWPRSREAVSASFAVLVAAGLCFDAGIGTFGYTLRVMRD